MLKVHNCTRYKKCAHPLPGHTLAHGVVSSLLEHTFVWDIQLHWLEKDELNFSQVHEKRLPLKCHYPH